jgi:hypothetical protein
MSTPIWDEGNVAACLCATQCDRCDKRGRCIQILSMPVGEPVLNPRGRVNLCFECYGDLSTRILQQLWDEAAMGSLKVE